MTFRNSAYDQLDYDDDCYYGWSQSGKGFGTGRLVLLRVCRQFVIMTYDQLDYDDGCCCVWSQAQGRVLEQVMSFDQHCHG